MPHLLVPLPLGDRLGHLLLCEGKVHLCLLCGVLELERVLCPKRRYLEDLGFRVSGFGLLGCNVLELERVLRLQRRDLDQDNAQDLVDLVGKGRWRINRLS